MTHISPPVRRVNRRAKSALGIGSALLVAATLVAGCSSSADSTSAESTSAMSTASGPSASTPAPAAPAAAHGVEATINDVPWEDVGPGWTLATWSPVIAPSRREG